MMRGEEHVNRWIEDFPLEITTYKELTAMMEAMAWSSDDLLPSQRMAAEYRKACDEAMYGPLDREVERLVFVLNAMDGIRTCSSCCGHGEDPFDIWFHAQTAKAVRPLYELIRPRRRWHIAAGREDFPKSFVFELRGPKGQRAYDEAEQIAEGINRRHAMDTGRGCEDGEGK